MLVWSSQYETKIDAVDTNHKTMFELLNKLFISLQQGDIKHEDIESTIQLLIHYTKTNFHNEELLMIESHIDQRHLSIHRMEHQSFIYDINQFNESSATYDRRIIGRVEKLVRFMTFWLTYHTLGTDLLMASQLANIKSGISPQQAFESLKHQKHDALTVKMIQDALLNLWLESKGRCALLETKCNELDKKVAELEMELQIISLT